MGDDESMWPIAGGGLAGAALLAISIGKANENNTSAWEEMLNIFKSIGLFTFNVAFALFIAGVVLCLLAVTLEKVRVTFVSWRKSKEWCETVEGVFEKNKLLVEEFRQDLSALKRENEYLERKLQGLRNEILAMKEAPGSEVKEIEAMAEDEIIELA